MSRDRQNPRSLRRPKQKTPLRKAAFFYDFWSGREDSNLRPLGPEPSALPG